MTGAFDGKLARYQSRLLVLGMVFLAISVLGAFLHTKQFYISYLYAWLFWLGIAMGSIVITMIHHLTGGRWGHPIRRIMEAGLSTLPLLAVLFVPVLFGLGYLYPWAARSDASALSMKRTFYLSPAFFIVRALLYFSVWIYFSIRLRNGSLAQDHTPDPEPARRLRVLSGPGLVLLPLTATFAYVDWIMSLEPNWSSTVFSIVILSGQLLAAFAFATLLLRALLEVEAVARVATSLHFHQLGNFLLTFVMFWAYVAFGQLLIIYAGNRPDEISWYLHRIAGSWKYILELIVLFHFFVPFLLLLFRRIKQHRNILSTLAGAILVVHLVYAFWLVTPSRYPAGFHLSWLDVFLPVGIGGIWLGAFLWLLRRAPLIPENDPRISTEWIHASD